jgi:uncharacterized membrane protein YphA (DoxX/SURF4 family)
MKHIIHKMYYPTNDRLGSLVLRVTLGAIFLTHGIQKLSNMEGTIGFFGMIGFSAFWAWTVALIETIGGAAVILGIGTRIWSSLLAIIMLVVITKVKSGKGFQAMELDIVLLGLALGVGLISCGKWSMCHWCHKGACDSKESDCSCGCSKCTPKK